MAKYLLPLIGPLLGSLLVLFAGPARAEGSAPVLVAEHRYLLDPSGTLGIADLATKPERFRPLPVWWYRDPPGVVRWEQLSLRWPESGMAENVEPVLHLRVPYRISVAILYPPATGHCGETPLRVVPEAGLPITVARWVSVPLCPGASSVYLRFITTRDAGPVVEAKSRWQAGLEDFLTSARGYILGGLSFAGFLAAVFGALRTGDPLWFGLLARVLLGSPYLLQHAAVPDYAPAASMVRLVRQLPADFLAATASLGTVCLVVGAAWGPASRGSPRRLLTGLLALAVLSPLVTLLAPYPVGVYLAQAALALATPVTLAVIFHDGGAASSRHAGMLTFWERPVIAAIVIVAGWSGLLIFDIQQWERIPVLVAVMYVALASWVALQTAIRRKLATEALFAEQLSRQRADDRAREQEERRLETRDLILMLTHEIRTPLSVLRLSVDQVGRSEPARQRAHAAIVEMDRLIERCLETAKLDTETLEATVACWSVADNLQDVVARARNPERISLTQAGALELAGTNPAIIDSIVAILLDNALRYGAAAGDVRLDAATRPGPDGTPGICVTVTNLIGPFGAPDADRVFRKYYRGPGAHRQSGAGLGLYLASRLAERIGGHLAHFSDHAHTRFQLWIPR